jgi:hypothetical protein
MTNRILTHYSGEPIQRLRDHKGKQEVGDKPRGLWVSVEGEFGWKEWCEGEAFRLDRFSHVYNVKLKPDANIVTLRTPTDIDNFTQEFMVTPKNRIMPYWFLDWPRISQLHQGILIYPYQWERRLHEKTMWYYGWDCASGCIWDNTAIAELNLMESLK